MHVSDIMTLDPETCQPGDTLRDVARKMSEGDFGSMPVIEGDRLVGVVTDRDIAIRGVAEGLGSDAEVSQVMTPDPVCVSPDTDVEEAAEIMQEEQIRRLFVTDDDDRLIGVVALGDVALAEDEELSGETLEQISDSDED
jgi:CBS domain-containing protein